MSAPTFILPAAGAIVNNYFYQGTSAADGASLFTVPGGYKASLSQIALTSTATGSFTINIATVAPEAGTLALGVLPALGVLGAVVVRRRKPAA